MTDYEIKKIAKLQAEYLVKALKEDDELLDLMYPPRYMDAEEAAAFCRIPLNTLYQKINSIPHTKAGRKLVFSDRGLVRWLNRRPSIADNIEIKPAVRKVM